MPASETGGTAVATPVIDLAGYRSAGTEYVRAVDYALRTSGFLRVRGHGVPAEVRARARENAAVFFSLPPEVKKRYRTRVGGRGWIPLGAEANGYASGVDTPPDLKESFSIGPDDPPPGSERHHDLLLPNV